MHFVTQYHGFLWERNGSKREKNRQERGLVRTNDGIYIYAPENQ